MSLIEIIHWLLLSLLLFAGIYTLAEACIVNDIAAVLIALAGIAGAFILVRLFNGQ